MVTPNIDESSQFNNTGQVYMVYNLIRKLGRLAPPLF